MDAVTAPPGVGRTALVVDDDEMVTALVQAGLEDAGMTVVTASDGHEALTRLAEAVPDVVVSDVNMPGMDGFTLISRLRAEPATRRVPLLFLTSRTGREDVLQGLRLGADDYVRKPFDLDELIGRVLAKVQRPPVPVDEMVRDVRTGVLSRARLLEELGREAARAQRTGRAGAVAVLEIAERETVLARYGARGDDELALQVTTLLASDAGPLEQIGRDTDGLFLLILPESDESTVRARLQQLSEQLASTRLTVAGERLQLTPVIGWTLLEPQPAEMLLNRAALAADGAWSHLDLQPVEWTPALEVSRTSQKAGRGRHRQKPRRPPLRNRLRTPFQIAATLVLGVVLPFLVYLGFYLVGMDISGVAYALVVIALLVTAASIWTEGFLALAPERPPAEPGAPHPPASAIIAAYLPNEAATVLETVEAFLRVDYPADLQIILAYNAPRPMPVERTLQEVAARHPRFVPFKVEGSTSKAQNVNAALSEVTGEFVGVFDADHHPDPTSYRRAWRWLSNGYDVVQGHCLIRNGDASWMARTVAVEFESIYSVSHPGRARLHQFGIFGGSNGYWRTDLLRQIRMHGFMLTEDIDSSLRVVENGGRIASDPDLISRELGPTTVKAVWNQRMRWAQGWFQVSMKHFPRAWRSPALSLRQKLGMTFLLGWREVYPWVSLQMFPLVAFLAWRAGGVGHLDWLVPLFVLTTLFTTSVGPGQTYFARRLAAPEIRRQRGWFLRYLVVSTFFYTEFKNLIARVAQIKEFTGEREWKVTPRSAAPASEPAVPATEPEQSAA